MTDERPADTIIAAIVEDLRDRSGLGDEWDQIPEDIRAEIVVEWARIVCDGLPFLHPDLPHRALEWVKRKQSRPITIYDVVGNTGGHDKNEMVVGLIYVLAYLQDRGIDANAALARRLEG